MPRRAAASASTDATLATVPELVPAPVPDEMIAEVYQSVRTIARDGDVRVHVEIGRVIFERFYGGDVEAFRSRGQKDASLRKLAARFEDDKDAPDGTSAPALYRAVAIYELDRRLGVSARKHLTLTHLRAVLGLPEKDQERLLAAAEEKAWTTRQLEDKAAKVRKSEADGRGRKPDPGFVKGIRRLGKLLDEKDAWFGDLEKVEELEPDQAKALWDHVTGMKLQCEALQKALEGRVPGVSRAIT